MSHVRAVGNHGAETKLKHLSEEQYIWFLRELEKLGGLAFAVAVDVGLHRPELIALHRDQQAEKVIEHRQIMLHAAARQGLTDLSELIRSLPVQLYTQLICQLKLFHKVLTLATLYFVQRHPPSLANFRWRLDQKARVPTDYELAFRKILPVILQTMSLEDPMLMLKEADYSYFSRFNYPPGEKPTYLKDQYGIETGEEGSNIGQMIREDFQLADSAATPGIQIADLIAGGIRRLLRGGFNDEESIARMLGTNIVQPFKGGTPIDLITLDQTGRIPPRVAHLMQLMTSTARPMMTR